MKVSPSEKLSNIIQKSPPSATETPREAKANENLNPGTKAAILLASSSEAITRYAVAKGLSWIEA